MKKETLVEIKEKEQKEKKQYKKNLVLNLLELIPIKEIMMSMLNWYWYGKIDYGEICNHINESNKTLTEESTEKSLTEKNSKRLLELKFEENHSIKSKSLKFISKKILPSL